MPALMSKRPSVALREIHRELDRRRKLAAVAKGRIMKKSSVPSPVPNAATGAVTQKSPAPIPHKPAAMAIMKPSLPTPRAPAIAYEEHERLGEAPKRCTARRDPLIPSAMKVSGVANGRIQKSPAPIPHKLAGAAMKNPFLPMLNKPAEAATKKSSASISHAPTRLTYKKSSAPISRTTPPLVTSSTEFEPIQEGTTVVVRKPMGTTPKGLRLFIQFSAVVVSGAEDGYFEVMYKGDFPRGDPFRTVRVARDQVKKMLSSSSSHQ